MDRYNTQKRLESSLKVLVTGINGFVGGHLTERLNAEGHDVDGCGLQDEINDDLSEKVSNYYKADLTEPEQVDKIPLEKYEAVIHLAGLAAVGASFDNPSMYMRVNEGSVIELFESSLKKESVARFLIVSSGAVYASEVEERNEDTEVRPTSPYAASKLGSETWAQHYQHRGFDVVIARPFNHAGPGQEKGFIIPDIASQIAEGKMEIQVGNIATERDYTDVRDVVSAYEKLISTEKLNHTIYNVCSGDSYSGEYILKTLISMSDQKGITYKADVDQLRPSDVAKVVGSNDRIHQDTGWKPEIDFDDTLRDSLDDWSQRKTKQ